MRIELSSFDFVKHPNQLVQRYGVLRYTGDSTTLEGFTWGERRASSGSRRTFGLGAADGKATFELNGGELTAETIVPMTVFDGKTYAGTVKFYGGTFAPTGSEMSGGTQFGSSPFPLTIVFQRCCVAPRLGKRWSTFAEATGLSLLRWPGVPLLFRPRLADERRGNLATMARPKAGHCRRIASTLVGEGADETGPGVWVRFS